MELKLTFKDGGAFDFHTAYERVRERLLQAAEVAGMDGGDVRVATQAADLEDLPAYVEVSDQPLVSPVARPVVVETPTEAPNEPPPAYEAPQRDGLQGEVERALGQEEREVWGGEGSSSRESR